MSATARLERWGRIPYPEGHRRQLACVDQRRSGHIQDTLILCEHDAVITVGRGYREPLPPNLPFPTVDVERGGLLTYHGPGQLVGYPIFLLEQENRDLHRYLERLEGSLVHALNALGIDASGRGGGDMRGVWVEGRKIASIGVAVRRWVTYHGFALNVETDLRAFRSFNPCGFDPEVMTSLRELGHDADWETVSLRVIEGFEAMYGMRFESPGDDMRREG